MIKTIIGRIVPLLAIAIFVAALTVLYGQFADVSPDAILVSLGALTRNQIVTAIGLTVASYLLLTGFDFLALRFVGRRLKVSEVLLASFTAFAFSNNIGFQLLSGGSIRYRIYSNLGIAAGDIGRVVAFCTFTYALGVATVGGLIFALQSAQISSLLSLPRPLIVGAGAVMLAFSVGYLSLAATGRWCSTGSRIGLRMPSLRLAIAQIVLASADAALAAAVIYVLLPVDLRLGFQSFIGIYMIAGTVSVFSLVPGGLGVFETAMTLMVLSPSNAAALGTLLTYRVIYFILPFVFAIALFALHEVRRLRTCASF